MSLPKGYEARPTGPDQANILAGFRLALFRTVAAEPFDEAGFLALDQERLAQELASDRTQAWLAWRGQEPVASCALTLYRLLPKPWNPAASYGYLSSLYTLLAHRRQGLARGLMDLARARARELGCAEVALHAAPDGRPLYEALGFAPSNEMRRKA